VVRHAAEALVGAGLQPVIVVAGHERLAIEEALSGLAVEMVVNPHPEAGQASSVRTGIAALPASTAAAVIALGDQPAVPRDLIPRLIAAATTTGKPIAAPRYRDGLGNPVLFRADVFPELLALAGDRGARAVIERDPARVAVVEVDHAMPLDLDTPEDYARLRSGDEPV
jgi:molybdenum cofactor cytidylyltransferase